MSNKNAKSCIYLLERILNHDNGKIVKAKGVEEGGSPGCEGRRSA
jgi:hypothetical protein